MRIARKQQVIELVFEAEDGTECVRSFLLKEQSAMASGLFLRALDHIVQEERAAFVPAERVEEWLFERACSSMDAVLVKLLRVPRDHGEPLRACELAGLSESQKQAVISAQCELNSYSEELMGNVSSLLIRVHAQRLAGVMVDHLEATTPGPASLPELETTSAKTP